MSETTYVTGFRIWQHEVEWRGHGITRPGYLFFGTPNQRSTAQPPREFYLYMIQPYDPQPFKDAGKSDEVFFRLVKREPAFEEALRLYAGAREMALSASNTRPTYEKKAEDQLKKLATWLRNNLSQAFEVTYKGVPKTLLELGKGQAGFRSNLTPRELINASASLLLSTQFEDALPNYPSFRFKEPITQASLSSTATEAVNYLTTGVKTQPGAVVLEGLELKDDDRINARNSRYGKFFLGLLDKKGQGQVVNRSEILEDAQGVERDRHFKLEPEWVATILLALAYQGDIALAVPGKKLDASNLEEAAKLGVQSLKEFKHIERPKELPLGALKSLFELLGLAPGLVTSNDREQMVQSLQAQVGVELTGAVNALQELQGGLPCWNAPVLVGDAQTDHQKRIEGYKTFLESLQTYDTPGKLKNFRYSPDDVEGHRGDRALVKQIEELAKLVAAIQPLTSYLSKALAVLPSDNSVAEKIPQTQQSQLARLGDLKQLSQPQLRASLTAELEALKREYIGVYLNLHKRARLSLAEDRKKAKIGSDPRFDRLKALQRIEFMNVQQLHDFQNAYANLRSCQTIGETDIAFDPICPNCNYRPVEEPTPASAQAQLAQLDTKLEQIYADWKKALQTNLDDPSVRKNVDLLKKSQRNMIETFLKDVEFPERVTNEFVDAVNAALRGLVRVPATPAQVIRALTEGGMPCDVKELKARFETFVENLTAGKDVSRVRVVIESSEEKKS